MKEDYLISIEKQMKAKELIERTSQTSIDSLKRLVNSYILVLLAVISIGGIGHILFKEVKRIVASAPCPTELQSTITGTVEIDASNYATDNVIDCSAVDITVANGGILRILPYVQDNSTAEDDFGIVLKANSFTVESGGTVDLEGQGYAAGVQASHVGSGKSSVDTCSAGECGGSGGGHGGAGGKGDADPTNGLEAGDPGESYGDEQNPLTLGSGGGTSSTGLVGGEGGGAIKVEVGCDTSGENCTGVFTNNGQITANGKIGTTDSTTGGGGGGGGSIWIESGTLSGSGILRADGGDGGSGGRVGGGGGGGLVAAKCWEANNASYTMSATGGTGGANDGQAGRIVGPSCYPTEPINLAQYERISYNPSTRNELSVGESTKKTIMEFEFNVGDIDDPEGLIPEIELIEDQETFSGNPTHAGSQITYEGTQVLTKVTATGITKAKEYKWRARVRDDDGLTSNWVQFGDNGEDADFTVLGNPAQIVYVSGDEQTGTVGEELAQPFVVELQDSAGHPYPGVTIGWDVKQGGGSVSSETTTTGDDFAGDPSNYGRAQTSLTLGIESGNLNNKVEAYRNGVNSVVFEATANPSVLHHYTIEVPSVALINTNFDPAVNISARDQYENLITTNNDTLNLSGVLAESGCPDTCNPGGGSVSPAQVTLTNGEIIISNLQYDAEEAIKIKAVQDGGSILGYSSTVNVVSAYGSCFGVANDPANSPMTLTLAGSPWIFNASPSNGGVINCSNIDLTVEGGAEVQLGSYDSGDDNWANDFGVILEAKSIAIESGGTISADAGGYGTQRGLGGARSSNQVGTGGSGASYGGYGYNSSKAPYGSVYEPSDLGSGGVKCANNNGGGAIKLIISEELSNEGLISSNGGGNASDDSCIGGSGGSILIDTDTVSGDGVIESNGGTGGEPWGGKSGAGGRIAIYYNTDNSTILNTLGTTNSQILAHGGTVRPGGPGTIYVEEGGVHPVQGGDLYVDNNNIDTTHAGLIEDTYQFNTINLTRYGHLDVMGEGSVLTVTSGSGLLGDSTVPDLEIYGIFDGPNSLSIEGVDVVIRGDINLGENNGTSTLTIGETMVGEITLYANTWARSGSYSFGDITVSSNGRLSLISYDNEDDNYTNDYGIDLALDNLTVLSGGVVRADAGGYGTQRGLGGAVSSNQVGTGGSGASYGGYGYNSSKAPYGSVYEPSDLGSGGVKCANNNGGGAIKLIISEELSNEGLISSNGGGNASDDSCIGGSGGSILIDTDTVSGDGVIESNGGTGGEPWGGKSGAGGRIAIYYNTDNSTILNTLGTTNSQILAHGGTVRPGGPGTIYVEEGGVHPVQGGDLYVDNNNIDTTHAGLIEDTYQFNTINLTRYGHLDVLGVGSVLTITDGSGLVGDSTVPDLTIYGTFNGPSSLEINGVDVGINGEIELGADNLISTLTIGETMVGEITLYANTWARSGSYSFGDITVSSNGRLSLISYDNEDDNYTNDYGIDLTLNNLTVLSGGVVRADACGYGTQRGLGGARSSNQVGSGGSGASYGGYGYNSSKAPYGSVYEPSDLGSGGVKCANNNGGGAIKLIISEELSNEGLISSNGGGNASDSSCIGGSGGSILIDTDTVSGDGVIESNGGTGGEPWGGKSGAGGRIAIYYNTDNSTILNTLGTTNSQILAHGGTVRPGGPGTIYVEEEGVHPVQGGDLYVDNNNIDTTHAGLPEDTYQFNTINLTRYGHLDVLGGASYCVDHSEYTGQSTCEDAGFEWHDGGSLTITSGAGLVSDDTIPDLNIHSTFIAPSTISINGIDVGIKGDLELGADNSTANLTIGDISDGSLSLDAHTWAKSDGVYEIGDITLGFLGSMNLVSYDNGNTNWYDDFGVTLKSNSIDIANGGAIKATGKGYSIGPGYGSTGSYGGYGAGVEDSTKIYGDIYLPEDLGSKNGGGAIKFQTTNLNIDGSLESNAEGDGSGGSVLIETEKINGVGTIKANGSSGGSGGRVAIYYELNEGLDLNKDHLQSRGADGGGPGTVYVEKVDEHSSQQGNLYIDNNGVQGRGMDFESTTGHNFNDIKITGATELNAIPNKNVLPTGVSYPDLPAADELEVDPDMIGLWHMNESEEGGCGDGNDVCDQVGQNHGVSTNTSITTSGRFYNAREFDEDEDLITIDPHIDLAGTFSVSSWIKQTPETDSLLIIGSREQCSNSPRGWSQYRVYLDQDGKLNYQVDKTNNCGNGSSGDRYRAEECSIDLNIYAHIVVTVENNSLESRDVKFYVNGEECTTNKYQDTDTSSAFSTSRDYKTFIGANSDVTGHVNSSIGVIDELAIYDKMLSQAEVNSLYGISLEEYQTYVEDFNEVKEQRVGAGTILNLTGDFYLDETSHISADGQGFGPGDGPQPGEAGSNSSGTPGSGGAGGGHGGAGGDGEIGAGNPKPGGGQENILNSINPRTLGSGGGVSGDGNSGGYGGGALAIKTDLETGSINIDGKITANGTSGEAASSGGGGGAGGSIYFEGCDVNVGTTGSVEATGGDGGTDTSSSIDGGGGGGGIISILYGCSSDILGTVDESEGSAGGTGAGDGGDGYYQLPMGIPSVQTENQHKVDEEEIPLGATISDRAVKFKMDVVDPDPTDTLRPEIELTEVGTDFDETNIQSGEEKEWTEGVPVQLEVIIENTLGYYQTEDDVLGITSDNLEYGKNYKWRARAVDSEGVASNWVEFGDNGDDTDFAITTPGCGNSILEEGEECDDGNTENNDGCSNLCQYEVCGDGYKQTDEECDDGNTEDNDGCNASCELEYCGDEIIQPGIGEECEGSSFGGLTCTDYEFDDGTLTCNSCEIETTGCVNDPVCGNGVLESGEQCDDGNTVDGDGCNSVCELEQEEGVCGDGELNIGEECDDGNTISGDGCSDICRREQYCGDGVLDEGEECDDGNQETGDGCSATCQLEEGSYCGDGIQDDGEECDDGNTINGDGCSSICQIEETDSYCGDGVKNNGEECDDGNQQNGDGCSNTCELEYTDPVCGNGVVEYGEQCDGDKLGNKTCEDLGFSRGELRCNNECKWDTNECISGPVCGNGVVEEGEQCDGETSKVCSDFPGYSGDGLVCTDGCKFDFSNCNLTGVIELPQTGQETTIEKIAKIALPGFAGITGMISILLAFPGILIKKEKNPWGVVYDENTGKPVAFAVVRLYAKSKDLVDEKITDLEGRYGFTADKGEYQVEVEHEIYKRYKRTVDLSKDDVNKDIGLERKKDKKRNIKVTIKEKLKDARELLPSLSKYTYFLGLAWSLGATVYSPVLYNILILIFYGLMGLVYVLRSQKRNWGKVHDEVSRKGIAYAMVRLFDLENNKLIRSKITDKDGKYKFVAEKGKYGLLANKRGYKITSKKQKEKVKKVFHESIIQVKLKKDGVIGEDMFMDRVDKNKQEEVFSSPFS